MKSAAIAIAVALGVGCGSETGSPTPHEIPVPFTVDYYLPCGLSVHIDATRELLPTWVGSSDADANTCKIAAWVEDVAGAPRGTTAGLLIVWTGEFMETSTGLSAGIYHGLQRGWAARWTEVSTLQGGDFTPSGPRETALQHELFHDLVWDPSHSDPRWQIIGVGIAAT